MRGKWKEFLCCFLLYLLCPICVQAATYNVNFNATGGSFVTGKSSYTFVAGTSNLIQNGSFETGDGAYWSSAQTNFTPSYGKKANVIKKGDLMSLTGDKDYTMFFDAADGLYAMNPIAGYNMNGSTTYVWVYQDVTVTNYRNNPLELRGKAVVMCDGHSYLAIEYFDANGNSLGRSGAKTRLDYSTAKPALMNSTWENLFVNSTVPATATRARVYLACTSGGADESAFDKIELTVPTNPYFVTPIAARTGYTFKGWYTAVSGGTFYDDGGRAMIAPASETTYYAQWTPSACTLTFNTNGGSMGTTSVGGSYGSVINLSSYTPTKSDNTFSGWYQDAALTIPVVGSYTMNGNAVLYAKWTKNMTNVGGYIVKLKIVDSAGNVLQNGAGSVSNNASYAIWGKSFAVIMSGVESGSLILWVQTENSKYSFVNCAVDGSLVATWQPSRFYSKNSGTDSTYYTIDDVQNLVSVPGIFTVTLKTKTVNLTYNANKPSVTGGSVTNMPSAQTCDIGQTVKLSDLKPALTGYTFAGWNTKADGSGTVYDAGSSMVSPVSNSSLYAQWEAQTGLTVNYYDTDGDTLLKFHTYTFDGTADTFSPEKEGNAFLGWAQSSEEAKAGTIVVAKDAKLSSGSAAYQTGNAAMEINLYAVWDPDDIEIAFTQDNQIHHLLYGGVSTEQLDFTLKINGQEATAEQKAKTVFYAETAGGFGNKSGENIATIADGGMATAGKSGIVRVTARYADTQSTNYAYVVVPGDVDRDGTVALNDAVQMASVLRDSTLVHNFDVTDTKNESFVISGTYLMNMNNIDGVDVDDIVKVTYMVRGISDYYN